MLTIFPAFTQTRSELLGEWKVQEYPGKKWILEKHEKDTLEFGNWGKFFEFREDGTYSEYASAPCGLDDNRYTYSGKWIYHPDSKTIELKDIKSVNARPGIYNNYKVLSSGTMKVLSWQDGALQVQVMKYWEKVTKKNVDK
jgi:hypothetical protein